MDAIILVVLGLTIASAVAGLVSWNSGGRRVFLAAVVLLAACASTILWAVGGWARYLSSGVYLCLLVWSLGLVQRDAWHRLRLEWMLATGAILAIVASVIVSSRPAMLVLADLAVMFGTAFICIALVRTVRMFMPRLWVRK